MRVLISADMEGASGVTSSAEVRVGGPEWQEFRHLLTGDVNAAIEGFYEGGATEIIVNEAHATARNLVLAKLDARATVIRGRPKPLGMMEGIDSGIDALAFVGYHARAGADGTLSHTYIASGIVRLLLNGNDAGEGSLNAALASEYGIPVALVTGDDRACAEAALYAPAACRVAVKRYIGRFAADCLAPVASASRIREAATRGLLSIEPPAPIGTPVTIEVEFATESAPSSATAIPGVVRVGARTVRYTCPRMYDAYRCFKVLTVLAADAIDPTYG